ncbi:MAG: hypothetical protein J6I42_07860 [Clostridia bacterium]|nr:hypothetical protein [Clostridia bacterium]MBO5256997.1 hypothetical protein [Clostridia bacterium]MBQ7312454.1 hypothetical protein [Clostridia bacterium]
MSKRILTKKIVRISLIILLIGAALWYFIPREVSFCSEMHTEEGNQTITLEGTLSVQRTLSEKDRVRGTIRIDDVVWTLVPTIDLEIEDIAYLKKILAESDDIPELISFHFGLAYKEWEATVYFTPEFDHLQVNIHDESRQKFAQYFSRISDIVPAE